VNVEQARALAGGIIGLANLVLGATLVVPIFGVELRLPPREAIAVGVLVGGLAYEIALEILDGGAE
jgi:hypothetical protein